MTKCKICTHRKRDEINRDIINGVSYRTIAKQYDVSPSSLARHKKGQHISTNITATSLTGRDVKGRFTEGNPGRPKGSVSIVGIIKEKLAQVSPDEKKNLAEFLVDEYLEDAVLRKDGTAIRDLADRIDGKPRQSVEVSHSHQDREWLTLFQNIGGTAPGTMRNVTETSETKELAFKPSSNPLEELRFRAFQLGIPPDIVESRLNECVNSKGEPDEQAGMDNLASYIRNYEHTKVDVTERTDTESATHAEIPPKVIDIPENGSHGGVGETSLLPGEDAEKGTPPGIPVIVPDKDKEAEMGTVSASNKKAPETVRERHWREFLQRQAKELEQEAEDEDYRDAFYSG